MFKHKFGIFMLYVYESSEIYVFFLNSIILFDFCKRIVNCRLKKFNNISIYEK